MAAKKKKKKGPTKKKSYAELKKEVLTKDAVTVALHGRPRKYDWALICRDFIATGLVAGKRPTYAEMAKKWGLPLTTVRARASADRWVEMYEAAVVERNEQALTVLMDSAVLDEVEIRRRQVSIGRLCASLGIARLDMIDPGELTVKEATELVKLGVDIEARGAGLTKEFVLNLRESDSRDRKTEREKLTEVGTNLLEWIASGCPKPDVPKEEAPVDAEFTVVDSGESTDA